jgi:hypothetical protein
MTESIENLTEALQRELAEYTQMVALLDLQQQQIGARQASEVYQSIAPIKEQGAAIQRARQHRDDCRGNLAELLRRARDLSFADLIPLLPDGARDLVGNLVKSNNEMLARVRQRSRQNHMRLGRSIELLQGLMNSILPTPASRVYTDRGMMKMRRPNQRLLYEACG